MKKSLLILTSVVVLTLSLTACKPSTKPGKVSLKTNSDSLSYALGYIYGLDIAAVPYDFNLEMLFKGLVNAQDKSLEILSEEQIMGLLDRFQSEISGRKLQEQEQTRIKNQTEGQKFMEQNAQKEGVKTTESGLQYRVIKAGTGRQVQDNDTVTAHYTGKFLNGETFDSSHNYGEPMSFNIDMVIPGWSEGLKLMREGDILELIIPDHLGYGEQGYEIIEPGAYLIFEIELISID